MVLLITSIGDIASALQIPGNDDPNKDTLDLVKTWLRGDSSSKWLMIVDNVDDMKSLKGKGVEIIDGGESEFNLLKYLPECTHGKLLFTTRSKTAALRLTGNGPIVQIPSMDANEAQELLRVRLKDDASPATAQDCLDLVKTLEYLPLAVSHAASYIREMEITPARYLRMFNDGDKKRTKLLTHTYEDLARDDGQSNTVLTTWRISFEQIERDSPESASLLKLMGTLHWQDIPQYLLQQGDLEDEDDFQDAMNPLVAFSLVQKSPDSKTFSMHRLIHIAIKSWDQTLEFECVAERYLVRVFPLLDINRVSIEQRQRCRQLLPHAQAIIDALAKQDESSLPSIQLKFRISLYMSVLGQYRRSRELGQRLIGPVRELSGRGQSEISPSVLEDHITRMFLLEGNDKVALDRSQKALDQRKEVLLPDNPDLIRAKDLVAMSLMAQGNNKEAETQLREAHEALEKARGKRDLETILVLLSLAVAYSEQQRWELSVEAYQAALDVLLPMYGDHNDCVIRCMEGLAEAERCLYVRALSLPYILCLLPTAGIAPKKEGS
jgi:tetratricopeptide (TPR) repeat protein